jgi:hypothetical protein
VYYPEVKQILGQPVVRDLRAVQGQVDILDVFRRPQDLPQASLAVGACNLPVGATCLSEAGRAGGRDVEASPVWGAGEEGQTAGGESMVAEGPWAADATGWASRPHAAAARVDGPDAAALPVPAAASALANT